MKQRLKLFICLLVFAFGGIVHGFSTGPVASRTGAPGEITCVDCHDEFELNRGPGRVTISNLPKTYSPGQRITIRVNVSQSKQQRWGFQITALDLSEQFAGQFVITDPARTQIISGNSRMYVEHTAQGSQSNTSGANEWSFDWIAPSSDIGPITFYVAGNAADGQSDTQGDYIYTNIAQLGAPSDPTVTLRSPNGGENLSAGDTFTINWDSSNATAHNLLFQANGSGDVPKTIVNGLAASVKEFKWTVPNIATTKARVIVVAEGQQSRADSDSSNNDFTITATTQLPGPTVSSIKVTNKKIKIDGSGFVTGTTVMVNNIGFVSAAKLMLNGNEIIQKGNAVDGSTINKLIPAGARVRIKITNPDGGVTELDFTRPSSKSAGQLISDQLRID